MYIEDGTDSASSQAREDKEKLEALGVSSPDVSQCFQIRVGNTIYFCKTQERFIAKQKELGIYEGDDEPTREVSHEKHDGCPKDILESFDNPMFDDEIWPEL